MFKWCCVVMDPSRVVRILVAACLCCRLPTTTTAFSPSYLATLQPAATTITATTAVPSKARSRQHDRTCIASNRYIERRRRRRSCSDTELRAVEERSSSSSSTSTSSDRREFLKHVAGLSTLIGGVGVLAGRPAEAGAFCGEPYPYWAYYVDFDEVFVPFECEGYSGKLFVRTVGNYKEQKKVGLSCYQTLILHRYHVLMLSCAMCHCHDTIDTLVSSAIHLPGVTMARSSPSSAKLTPFPVIIIIAYR